MQDPARSRFRFRFDGSLGQTRAVRTGEHARCGLTPFFLARWRARATAAAAPAAPACSCTRAPPRPLRSIERPAHASRHEQRGCMRIPLCDIRRLRPRPQKARSSLNELVRVCSAAGRSIDGLLLGFVGGTRSIDRSIRTRASLPEPKGMGGGPPASLVLLRRAATPRFDRSTHPQHMTHTHSPPNRHTAAARRRTSFGTTTRTHAPRRTPHTMSFLNSPRAKKAMDAKAAGFGATARDPQRCVRRGEGARGERPDGIGGAVRSGWDG